MKDFFTKLAKFFAHNDQTELEHYIAARCPKNAGDVEYLMREYESNRRRDTWLSDTH